MNQIVADYQIDIMRAKNAHRAGSKAWAANAAWLALALTLAGLTVHPVRAQAYTGSVVKVVGNARSGFHLVRNGKPFFVKGAGGGGPKDLLAACGANSFRTWGSGTIEQDLADGRKFGLAVCEGIWLGHTEQGFNWSDPAQIAKQRDEVREAVLLGRDDPALLIWALGNEMEGYGKGDDPVIWNEIEYLAKMVKQLDPNHPVMTVVAEIGGDKLQAIDRYCPDVDIVGVNSYGGAPSLAQRYKAAGGTKPYIITEFGPPGVWELPKNAWGVNDELTSTQKAAAYRDAYLKSVENQPMCLGSYAFTWGNKQEATATWYGMLLPDGSRLAAVDTMRDLWTGKDGSPNAPVIHSFAIDGSTTVAPGAKLHASLSASDPQNDGLRYRWVLRSDHDRVSVGGQAQRDETTYDDAIAASSQSGVDVRMPSDQGAYRLYVYIYDKHDEAAVANIPLYVTGSDASAPSGVHIFTAGMSHGAAPRTQLPYIVYENGDSSLDFVASGYMGDTGAIRMDAHCTAVPGRIGSSCLQVRYTASDRWAGVAWQSPVGDWGDKPGGLDLSGARNLSFWARGEVGDEVVSFSFGLIGPGKKFPDTASGKLPDVHLSRTWTHYTIDLAGMDMSRVKTPFCWVVAGSGRPTTFYLDAIKYE